MGVFISGQLTGTEVTLEHEPSGTVITTTPPKDNQGDGTSFSPTDLFAASLGACTASIMALYARNHGVPLDGLRFRVEKLMQTAPRRVQKLVLDMDVATSCDDAQWQKLLAAGHACPVRLSLGKDVEVEERIRRVKAL